MNIQDKSNLRGYSAFSAFESDMYGIHFGGASDNSTFNFDYLSFKEQTKVLGAGIGMIPEKDGKHSTSKVVVPFVDQTVTIVSEI